MDLAADRAPGRPRLQLPTLSVFQLLRVFWLLSQLPGPARVSGAEQRQVFQVLEEQPPGTLVGTIQTRPGFTYRLSESHALFAINSSTGALYTTATIDRESLPSDVINLVVLSSSPTYPTEVRVLVRDLNDNAPVFPDPSIVVTFKEDSSSGRQVILDTATDSDIGSNGVDHRSYRIIQGNEAGRFRLDITLNPSGEGAFLHLVSKGGLDREVTPQYQLLVEVEDKGEPKRRGYLQVNVTVQDINDNPPVFGSSHYQAGVPEDAAVGSSVLQVAAADADEGTNADIRYRLQDEGTPFQMDPETGLITVREPLDFEARRQYSLTVQAMDRGVPSLTGRAEALIQLLDVNDNDPVVKFRYFPATSRYASVDENAQVGTVVALLTVTDADSPAANGNISVQILGGNEQRHFEVQSSKVPNLSLIKVASALDRERIPSYNLTVSVSDNYGAPPGAAVQARSSVASLVIFVNDINDHPPVFAQQVYRVNLSEEAPRGSYVSGVSATDGDSGLNANLRYSIVSGNGLGWFHISEHSGLVTTGVAGGLDRELASQIVLNISARDQGVHPKFSYAQLVVTLLDVNDEKPVFSQPEGYDVSVVENAPTGTELLVLRATDRDLGDNGTVRFSLQEAETDQRSFRLDPVSGRLSTIASLDREEQAFYSLLVLATDLGSPPQSSMVRINVSLLDVNDNSPVFYPIQYFAHIQENEPGGSYITTVSATDPDLGLNGTIKYSISAGDRSRFQVNAQSGVISTRMALDREEKTAYQLQIVATDGGNLQSPNQAIVTITVLDTQDNPPVFSQAAYSFVVFENVALGYHVGSVSASTMDLNSNISYLITTGDQKGMFAINQVTGHLTTASVIDREEQSFYQLKVVASGGTVTGDTMVNITVKDLNDNSPHFLQAVESVNVVENWQAGHSIFQAKAVDPDEGVNGMVLYSLKQNPKNLFTINEKNGNISLLGPLDVHAGSYQIEILASDMGVPQLSSSFILTVYVHDVNDNPPVFDQLSYEVTLSESEPVNSRFFKVQAFDKDSGANGEIAYSIAEGNTGDAFGIFPDGQLYIKSELDRELQDRYVLLVVASDRAVEPLSATVNVTVILEDVNDNRPLFNSTNYTFYFEEEQRAGSFVGKVNAIDKDFGPNGEVRYSFEMVQPDFELHAISGEIRNTRQFDRESLMRQRGTAVFSFTVIATDQGLPQPLKDQATVHVYMKDINDNAPKFLKDFYQATISESAANLTQVLRVSASDVDEGNNGLIHYFVMKGNEERQFAIDSTSGQVTLIGKLDYEATPAYSLVIQAVDSGAVSLNSTCTLNIDILDENDNTPSFPKSTLFVDVLENMRIGELVSSVTATDSDSGDNADLHYSITGTNNHGTFSISPNTGSIFLAKKLDFETQSLYKLNITAKDQGRPPRSSTMSVVIHVRDFNDNPPSFPPGDIFKSIVENIPIGTSVISVTAHDPDADINGQLSYTIIQQMPRGNHFGIDEVKGTIYTNAEIDREFANLFELTVKANDQAVPIETRRYALKNVTILVTDLNDNVPMFISQNALAADPSAVIGSVLTTIMAADPDEGANGEVEYEIINGDTDTFIVDRYSGDLRVASALVPSQLIYNLIVSATDLGPERRKSTTELTIILQGLDGPVFTQPKYITILKEGEPIGTNVISIEAASPRGSEAPVEYYIVSVRCEEKTVGRLFTIGRQTGVIQTAAILDREQGACLYLVDVYAIEKSTAFPRTQRAEGANALVTYTIISGADDSFRIDPESGDLIATKRLDRERRSKYSLLVRADDGLQSSDMRINITVSDVNDHTPKFSRPVYSFDIPEDTTPGSLVAAILATDDDSGVNGEITYIVNEDDEDGIFFLNPVTGVFNLTRVLDYEAQQYYILTVRAEDGGGQFTTIRVYFNVLDVNDNPPIFSLNSYSTSLMENLPLGSTVLVFNVTDADDGINSQLAYSIASGDSLGQFTVDKNGVLKVLKSLDREIQSFYNLVVQVHDLPQLPASRFTSTAHVSIILLDVNDNPPTFLSPKLTYIPENTPIDTIVFKAQATDPDSGPNSYIEYTLLNPLGNKFSIGTIDGEVRLTGELDREEVSNYTLTVVATDKGQPALSSSTEVVVMVLDINDNNPVFVQALYKVEINENTLTGTDIIQVYAADGDEGTNGQVRYGIVDGNANQEFRIDSVTGAITVAKPLDREKTPTYSLTVQAADRGSTPRIDTTTVSIVLLDINDFVPMFELSPYSVNVPENLGTLPRTILQVVARDDDQGSNSKLSYVLLGGNEDNAFTLSASGELRVTQSLDRETKEHFVLMITATDSGKSCLVVKNLFTIYRIIGGNSQFTINPSTGQIITSALLDRETKENYTLVVVSSDAGSPEPLSSSTSVLVTVTDVNDNPPRFQHHPYVTHIPSPTPPGSFVFAVTVTDADIGPNSELHYSLSGRNSEKFHIDPLRGAIMAAGPLNGASEVTFSVYVKDGGSFPKTDSTTVTVRFVNKADFPKVRAKEQTFMFPENQPVGTLVTTITGSSLRGEPLSYYIASGNLGSTFQIDQITGQVSISQPLDFEKIQKYVIWIEARDGGFPPLSSYEKLDLTVLDVNDNSPVFKEDPFVSEILENLSPRKILTVSATDKDSGPNGQLDYEIVNGNKEHSFAINHATGEIRSIRPLDREKISQYVLTIKSSDKGSPSQSTSVKVIINILDENDNAPRFSQIFSAYVPENSPLGYTVTRVTTSDEDIGINAISRYSITDTSLPFTINPSTGDIVISRPLNREDTDRYRIRVSAHDSGWTVSTDVTIFVTDINDNAPRFSRPSYYLDCPELPEIGSKVTQVSATDPDEGSNGQVFYFIKSQSEYFRINATTGEIFNKQVLKYQNVSGFSNVNINRHSFIVTSSDRGNPSLLSETTVTINTVDSNDNAPQFLKPKYFTPVTKNVKVGTKLIKVTAVDDRDFGLNSEVEYLISNENHFGKFKLDNSTGWISVASSLISDLNQNFLIIVTARDKGNPPLSSQATVQIIVTEENYHTPEFSQSHMSATIPESHSIGAIVRTVSARDRDAAMNGLIGYSISSGNEEGIFAINSSTGILTLAKALDYELCQKHEMTISATDGGWVARTGYCSVTVNVIDVNDNSPVFFPDEYFPTVLENAPSGTTVIHLNATDADSGTNAVIAYTLQSSDSDLFVIDPNTGVITTQGFLDFETKQSYHLTVKAFNVPDEERCSFATVNIQLKGTNEYVPRFVSKLYYFEISEAAPKGTIVGEVFASDRDLGTDGEVHYLIFGNSRKKGFQINKKTGQIYVSGLLDREKEERVSLKVLAKNFGSIRGADIDEVTVNVTVLDANDPPIFSLNIYSVQISEGVPTGTHVTFVSAFDSDSVPSWSRFSYFIGSGNENGAFSINPQTGQITVTAELDRETLPIYNLTVLAVDSGTPSATGSASLLVTLEDINDNGPMLTISEGEVMENKRPGTLVMTLQSTDPDLPPNQGPFTYYLLSTGPATNYFSLNTAGVLSTTREIDREQIADFYLSVITRDSGVPQMSSTGTVHITVIDQNDNPSQSRTVEIFVNYYGNLFPGGILGSVKPQDPDVLDTFHCSLTSGVTSLFSIPRGTCDLNSQPRSTDGTFDLTVLSNDGVHSTVTSNIRVFFAGFSNATVDNSILLRLSVPTVKDFLTNHYLHFLRIASSQLTGLGTAVQLYGAYEENNKTFLLAAVKRNNNQYVNPSGVATFFESIKEILLRQSGVKVESVDHDSCIHGPCQNGGSCIRRLAVSSVLKSHESLPVIIVANEPLQPFLCKCLPGYAGSWCEIDIDECLPSPCHNGGTCHNLVGGFSCSCPDGFTGRACERDINECLPGPCKNGAVCQNVPGSFNCVCKTGYTGNSITKIINMTLDVQPNRVTVGGIRSLEPILQRRGHVESHDFVGCIMEFAVNGRPLEPSQALAAQGILDQCPRLEGACTHSPCQHGGMCMDYWSWQLCHCKEGLTGKYCEKSITPDTALSLEGKGRLDYHMSQNEKREYLLRQSIRGAMLEPFGVNSLEIKFRTRSENGILIHIQESSNYTTVKIKNGKVHFTSDAGIAGKVERNIPEVYVADGHWHTLLIGKNGTATVLSIDRIYNRDIIHPTQDFGGLDVLTISLGGIPPNQAHRDSQTGFDGCIASMLYGGESLPFSGKHSLASISKTDPSVKIGCRGPNICASNPCWGDLLCINQWYAYKCVPPGDCASHPCQNGGSCEPGLHSGFTCNCPESHTGRTCETVVACLGVLCPQGRVCKAGSPGGHVCVLSQGPEEISLPLWAVPAIVGSCATVLALLVLSLILCNQCRGKKTKSPKEEKKPKEKKKKGSENVAFDDPDNIPPYGDDMTVRKQPEGNPKPDIIERENPYLIYDETDLPHSSETIPSAPLASPEQEIEHYDIDNASSIAPSDADIIQHYKQFRSHTPKFSIQRHSPLGFARQSPMPLGASSLTYQPSYGQGLRTSSLSHSACPTPNPLSRHSPAPFSKSSTFYRNSPARELHLPIRDGNTLEMHGDACQPGIFNYSTRLGRRSKSPQAMASHGSRPGSRLKQPIGQIPLESSPPVGLSIEEVERLNTPRPRNPSICSADHGRSSSEEDCRRPLSRTRNPADGIPAPESSSDSDSHESFTCSEMEYDREKPMVYTSRMPKLSQVNESDADDEDNYGARLKPRRYHGRRAEGGPGGTQAAAPGVADNTLPLRLGQQAGNFNWDNLLNWGPGFGHYVDVFKDLASLPEKAAANEEGKNGTTKPVPKDGEAEQYV
ncbi:protocadherin Fat 4 [Leptonychotes weddellii]|uniref:Protocadherin Fat 4 n=1 Tax=Leptonychotes weddellii TaxID=9713 RepID=A0A7F8RV84_LEPWE|nr:protocadherin Fat 4 [Leptonychotes weddellii]